MSLSEYFKESKRRREEYFKECERSKEDFENLEADCLADINSIVNKAKSLREKVDAAFTDVSSKELIRVVD